MDMQKFMDIMNATAKDTRADYHLTLGKLIDVLEVVEDEVPVMFDDGEAPSGPESYRGYYSDLAFPVCAETTAEELLSACKNALNSNFEGYKGGDFIMTEDTPLWRSEYGEASGLAIMQVELDGGKLRLVTHKID